MQPATIATLAQVITDSRPVAILTGAGISTDSGIPDYRGAGTPPRTPMNIAEFMNDPLYRKRFWAGASVNARRGWNVSPNPGHFALAALEAQGYAEGVITQNVDGLHRDAGTKHLVELHGSGASIRCTSCTGRFSRAAVIDWFEQANPGYVESQEAAEIAPDGDAQVTGIEHLTVPVCPICTGVLRPEVVYFGETVPKPVFTAAADLVERAGALAVIGSSLAVNTGIRLVRIAEQRGVPLIVINRGPTAVDHKADLRIESGATEALGALVEALGVVPGEGFDAGTQAS
ncbi:NAD-dependent deacetylase [Leucobacter sp. UCMA 4100]|uniref:Sir2 family NAD-dependent protein deacetylase n=1 Tax=Leucobacter sp. UCMA 4100 TaxID=2810534 RepID=UPI0022EA7670|nr:Sir2 family NAD-dependent protein deacetylase [Leucobacter sp. UCMA 4100]MDA3146547.1 NAD-dependent deacetylase [Leucobacter sp. UCMA 4100]